MPDFCTCGARLPEDARFCHKCGKPQYDYPGFEVEPEAEVVATPVPPPPPPPPAEISFRNRTAVRVGFVTALIAFLVISATMAIPFPIFLIAALAAGFLAVYFYTRRTGQNLSLISGARMGWITGIFLFSIVIVLFTAVVVTASSQGGFMAMMVQAQQQRPNPYSADITKLLQDPAGLPTLIITGVIAMFIFFAVLPTLGGALGAKLLAKEQ